MLGIDEIKKRRAVRYFCTSSFEPLARLEGEALELTGRLAIVPHPIGGIEEAEVEARASAAWPVVSAWLAEADTR